MIAPPPPTREPATDLLRSAQAGDPSALEELIRWCYPRVRRWALVRTGDSDEADDVTQEVMVGLRSRLPSFEGRSRFTTWLYRITANAAGAGMRRRLRRLALLAHRLAPAPVDEEARQLAALHGADIAGLVRALLRDLPPQQRTVFDLLDLQGFDADEVAAMLDLEPVTIRSHLMRARRAMRDRILARRPELREDA